MFNIVEEMSDDVEFNQPCIHGCKVETHAVYCHNEEWKRKPRKCNRTWATGGKRRDEDCFGFKPNPRQSTGEADRTLQVMAERIYVLLTGNRSDLPGWSTLTEEQKFDVKEALVERTEKLDPLSVHSELDNLLKCWKSPSGTIVSYFDDLSIEDYPIAYQEVCVKIAEEINTFLTGRGTT